jgi:hypothetical protein
MDECKPLVPGEPRAQFSTSDLDDPAVAGRATIGVVSEFTIFSRDRFGNKAGRRLSGTSALDRR